MEAVKIENVKRGEFIKRKPDARKVYVKGSYCRTDKVYRCDDWDDISRDIGIKRGTLVYVGFTF